MTLCMLALAASPLLALSSPGLAARAHVDTDSYAHFAYSSNGDAIELAIELDTDHLMAVTDAKPPLGNDWSEEDVRAIQPAALAYLASHWTLALDGLPVEWSARGFELLRHFDPLIQQERALRIAFRFTLPLPARDSSAKLLVTLFEGLEPAHRHTVLLEIPGRETAELRVPPGTWFPFLLPDAGPGSTARRLRTRAIEGATRGLGTPWFLLFAAALLLAPIPRRERLRSLLAAIAGAAVAYAAVRADWIAPARWAAVGVAALSVAYVAAENRFARPVRMRPATAALFGLVHGMALATVLRQGMVAPTVIESGAFAAAALLTATLTGMALATFVSTGSAFFARTASFVVDVLLFLAGVTGLVLAVVNR